MTSLAALSSLTRLRDLTTTWCRGLSATSFHADTLARLTRLDAMGLEFLGDEVCSMLPLVEELNLAYTGISNRGLGALAAGSPMLRVLTLAAKQENNFSSGFWTTSGLESFVEEVQLQPARRGEHRDALADDPGGLPAQQPRRQVEIRLVN